MEEKIVLTDPATEPDDDLLKVVLGDDYKYLQSLLGEFSERKLGLEWNYYRDGHNWLGKVLNSKKNLAWISIWNVGVKMTIFFSAKTVDGLGKLKVGAKTKQLIKNITQTGKLFPIIMTVNDDKGLADVITILDYKKSLK